ESAWRSPPHVRSTRASCGRSRLGGCRAYLSRPRRGVLRGRGEGLGLPERDGDAPFRGMDSAQGAELAFLRFAQRRLVRPPLARVIAPSEKRQHGKRNRDERDHCRNCRENIEKLAVQRDKYVTLSSGQHRVPCAALSTCASCSFDCRSQPSSKAASDGSNRPSSKTTQGNMSSIRFMSDAMCKARLLSLSLAGACAAAPQPVSVVRTSHVNNSSDSIPTDVGIAPRPRHWQSRPIRFGTC